MSAGFQANPTDSELLYEFLGDRLRSGQRDMPVEDVISEFAAYRRELSMLRDSLKQCESSSEAGLSRPLDVDDVVWRGRQRLASDGIAD